MERAARSSSGLTWLAAAFGAAACALAGEIGADSRWLAAVGAAIVRLGRIPHAIPYATAPSNGWHDAPALGQLCFHALEVALGDRGLLLAQVAAVGVALAALAADLRRAGARDRAGAAVVPAVAPHLARTAGPRALGEPPRGRARRRRARGHLPRPPPRPPCSALDGRAPR